MVRVAVTVTHPRTPIRLHTLAVLVNNVCAMQDDVDAKTMLMHPGFPPIGNPAHRAPELLDAARRLSQRGAVAETVSVAGQAVFEMGVLMFELLFKKHPLGTCYLGRPEGEGVRAVVSMAWGARSRATSASQYVQMAGK